MRRVEAQYHLQLNVWMEGQEYVVEARLLDQSGAAQLRKRYRSPEGALPRTAHNRAKRLACEGAWRPGDPYVE